MMRVLFLARYRHPTMFRKVEAMAAHPGMHVHTVIPTRWQDHFFAMEQTHVHGSRDERVAVSMLGDPTDPHRALYRTFTFGMRTFQPHIIHAEEEPDSLAAFQVALARRLFAPRARLILHTWQNLDRAKGLHVHALMRLTLAAADAICCANQEAADLLQHWGYTRPTPVIPAVGVDTETFRPCSPHSDETFCVGFVGRLVPEKGIDTLLEAVALLLRRGAPRPVSVIIVGSGPFEQVLQRQSVRLHLVHSVQFLGRLTPEAVARVMCNLDVLVLPSRTTPVWKEQLGRVLLEAMACGVPVIGSDSGAIPEVIGDAGLLFPEGDAAALADRLVRLAEDPALVEDLRHRGLLRAQQYSQVALARRAVAFYRELLA